MNQTWRRKSFAVIQTGSKHDAYTQRGGPTLIVVLMALALALLSWEDAPVAAHME
jgi:hypothetical protein